MGFVYQARQPKLDRFVALKSSRNRLQPTRVRPSDSTGRPFLARLNHPNIVTVHDFGQARHLLFTS